METLNVKSIVLPKNGTTRVKAQRILLIASDLVLRHTLFKVLSRAGYSVSSAVNTSEAAEFLSQLPYALVLLDLSRPFDGDLEELQGLLRASQGTKVIVLAPFDDRGIAEQARSFGVSSWLIKPIKKQDILSAVARNLGKLNS